MPHKEKLKSLDKFYIISSLPLFSRLSSGEKKIISNSCRLTEYNKNDILYDEKRKGRFFYIIASGRVSLFRSNRTKESEIEILRRGEYFGIISLLTGVDHSVSARVINDAEILRIDKKSFRKLLKKIPALSILISKELSRRLNEKYVGKKKVFKTKIIFTYYPYGEEGYGQLYAGMLAKAVKQQSPKGISIFDKGVKTRKEFKRILDKNVGKQNYILINSSSLDLKTAKYIISQADQSHLIIDDETSSALYLKSMLKKEKNQQAENKIKIILKKSKSHTEYKNRAKMKIYATLPVDKIELKKVLRRIAREITEARIGVALGSGGAIGLAEIGVMEVLEKSNIPIDMIAGTSIGALISALWAVGYKTPQIKNICSRLNTKTKPMGLVDITFPIRGLIAGKKVRSFLKQYLKDKTFYDVNVPLRIVACDIRRRQECIIKHGKLLDAVMASISIPGIFNPVITKDGDYLIDGGIVNPVPVSVLAQEGIKKIIAVNCMPSPDDILKTPTKNMSIIDIIANSFYAMEYKIAKFSTKRADVYLHPILKNSDWYEFYKANKFIKIGKRHAEENLRNIKELEKGVKL